MRSTVLSVVVVLGSAGCTREPPPVPPPVPSGTGARTASSVPAASASAAPRVAVVDAGRADAAVDPCVASFAKRLAGAQDAIEDAEKERASGKVRCAALRKKCTPTSPGSTAAVCNGASREDTNFYEDTCMRWSGVRWYDGSYTFFGPMKERKNCPDDPAALTIEESTWDDDVARIRGTRP